MHRNAETFLKTMLKNGKGAAIIRITNNIWYPVDDSLERFKGLKGTVLLQEVCQSLGMDSAIKTCTISSSISIYA